MFFAVNKIQQDVFMHIQEQRLSLNKGYRWVINYGVEAIAMLLGILQLNIVPMLALLALGLLLASPILTAIGGRVA